MPELQLAVHRRKKSRFTAADQWRGQGGNASLRSRQAARWYFSKLELKNNGTMPMLLVIVGSRLQGFSETFNNSDVLDYYFEPKLLQPGKTEAVYGLKPTRAGVCPGASPARLLHSLCRGIECRARIGCLARDPEKTHRPPGRAGYIRRPGANA